MNYDRPLEDAQSVFGYFVKRVNSLANIKYRKVDKYRKI